MVINSARETALASLPTWLPNLLDADKYGVLQQTLESYADNDMNALKTADALGVHPNTVYARIQKIEDLTAKNALNYHALTELLLAIEFAR